MIGLHGLAGLYYNVYVNGQSQNFSKQIWLPYFTAGVWEQEETGHPAPIHVRNQQ